MEVSYKLQKLRQNCEIERHGAIVKGEDGVGVKPGELILRQE